MEKETMNLQLFGEAGEETAPDGGSPVETITQEQEPVQEPNRETLHQRFYGHFRELERQAEALREEYPGFDLRRELKNPMFARLTAPDMGISVEDAYYTVHRRELQSAAVQAATRQVSNAIATGARRPRENGISGQAPAVSAFDYRSASKEQREDLKRRIRLAAAEGKKLYPGRN